MGVFDGVRLQLEADVADLENQQDYTDTVELAGSVFDALGGGDITTYMDHLRGWRAGVDSAIANRTLLEAAFTALEEADKRVVIDALDAFTSLHAPTVVNQGASSSTVVAPLLAQSNLLHAPTVQAEVDDGGYIVLTLDENNTGLLDAGALGSYQSTVNITSPGTYENLDCGTMNITASANGALIRNCRIRGGGYNTLNLTTGGKIPDSGVRLEHCYIENTRGQGTTRGGKSILGGGAYFFRCHVVGGGDGVHIANGGISTFRECIVEQQDYVSPDHSDAIQIRGPGSSGGAFRAYDCYLQARWNTSNGPVQLYTSTLTADVVLERNLYHGGTYFIGQSSDGGSRSVTDTNSLYCWGTSQYGINNVGTISGGKWYSRQHRPRTSAAVGLAHTPSGEAPNFPGNFAPLDDHPWEATNS